MLSSVAVLEILSLEFGVMVTEAWFCSSSVVISKWFFSSSEGSEAAIFLLATDLNAAIKREMGRILGLTHKSTEYQ